MCDIRHLFTVTPNKLNRQFGRDRPRPGLTTSGCVRATDIAYVWPLEGWVPGDWNGSLFPSDHRLCHGQTHECSTEHRGPGNGLLDARVCHEYRNCIDAYGMIPSMGRKGICWDDSPAERFFRRFEVGTVKLRYLHNRKGRSGSGGGLYRLL